MLCFFTKVSKMRGFALCRYTFISAIDATLQVTDLGVCFFGRGDQNIMKVNDSWKPFSSVIQWNSRKGLTLHWLLKYVYNI